MGTVSGSRDQAAWLSHCMYGNGCQTSGRWCGVAQSISVLPEILVFHHANVSCVCRNQNSKRLLEKSFLSRGKTRFTEKKQRGNFTLINGSWSLWSVCVCDWCSCAIEISFISEGKEVSCATLMNVSVCVCLSLFDWHRFLSGCVCSDLNSLALDPSYAQAVKLQKSVKSGTVFP